jgi:hypothetical protein
MAYHTIAAALTARHMRPGLTCRCCRAGGFIAEEMATTEHYPDAWIAQIEAIHGGAICEPCASDQTPCAICKTAIAPGEAHYRSGEAHCDDCFWADE